MNSSYSINRMGFNKNTKVLFVYPHPDDETYCNANLIHKLINNGAKPFVLCLTKGGASTLTFSLKPNDVLTDVRKNEFETVMKFLGVSDYKICDQNDGNLSSERE
jgi:N-acetylglucosamine malate deacetylase 2